MHHFHIAIPQQCRIATLFGNRKDFELKLKNKVFIEPSSFAYEKLCSVPLISVLAPTLPRFTRDKPRLTQAPGKEVGREGTKTAFFFF